MTGEYRPEGFEETDDPLPRDMPDQEADEQEAEEDAHLPGEAPEDGEEGNDVPDLDEAGAGPRGAMPSQDTPSDQPVPDEPTG
ncbi:hypothetical protein OHS70_35750 [Streptomyces sp. NBC_00390]|uniref:hypothetical protein n=1 Tax=Streptomyces sp. NBC_00390 TaxID=2975736 RepID=UPI002E214795